MGVTRIQRKPDNDLVRHMRELQKRDIVGWKFRCDVAGHGEFSALVFDGDFDRIECPACKEERRKADERRKAQEDFYDSLIKDNGVPADNVTATFETFEIREDEGDQVKFEDSLALRYTKMLYESIGSRDSLSATMNLTLCGKTGVGKSFLGAALVSAVKKSGRTAIFIQDSALLSMVLAAKGEAKEQLRKRFGTYDIVVVDDADHERWAQAKCTFFAEMIIGRCSAMKGLMILTNRPVKDFVVAFGSGVESRLKRGRVVTVTGEDRRKKQKMEVAG